MRKIQPICLPSLDEDRPVRFEVSHRIVGVIGKIRDYTQELHTIESAHLGRAVNKRRFEYATGRHFARIALASMGYPAFSIVTGVFREPHWPEGIVGSITHSKELALVIVGRRGNPFSSIGIDMEPKGSVSRDLFSSVLTQRELSALCTSATGSAIDATLIFSAKEAVYKAVNPITSIMVDFNEVEIQIDSIDRTFRANYIGTSGINGIIDAGIGTYCLFEDHFVSFFGIPPLFRY